MSSEKKTRLRIGLIGAGGNTRLKHAPEFQKIAGVECTVVCNRSESSSRKFADEFGIAGIAADWREVVNDPAIDAVCIGTWPYMHAEITCAALEQGKHVLTEARMAASLAEAEQMAAVSQQHPHLVAQIVPAPMSLAVDDLAIKYVSEGKLGKIRQVTAQHLTAHLASPEVPMSWRSDFRYSGKNILSMGIFHEIINRWGIEDPQDVEARAQFVVRERKHFETGLPEEVTIPDTVVVQGRYSEGGTLLYHFSGAASGTPFGEIRIHGDKGSLRFDLMTGKLFYSLVGEASETELRSETPNGEGWRVEKEFVASIREGLPVLRTSFQEGLRYMRFTDQVHASWSSRNLA